MLAELSIVPLQSAVDSHEQMAEAVELIDASGLPYQLTPAGTCIEGEWDEVMGLARRCHDHVRATSPHVITLIKIDDEHDGRDKILRNVASIEDKAGRALVRTRRLITPQTPPAGN